MQITEKQPVGKSPQDKTLIFEDNAQNSSLFSPANMTLEGNLEITFFQTTSRMGCKLISVLGSLKILIKMSIC